MYNMRELAIETKINFLIPIAFYNGLCDPTFLNFDSYYEYVTRERDFSTVTLLLLFDDYD